MIDFGAAPLGVLELIKERKGGDSKGYFLRYKTFLILQCGCRCGGLGGSLGEVFACGGIEDAA